MLGRPPLEVGRFYAGEWLIKRAEALTVIDSAPRPIVLGRHLIELGQKPGPHFGPLLEQCYEAQLDGEFSDLTGGMKILQQILMERKIGLRAKSVQDSGVSSSRRLTRSRHFPSGGGSAGTSTHAEPMLKGWAEATGDGPDSFPASSTARMV